jgi:hypothetical protein
MKYARSRISSSVGSASDLDVETEAAFFETRFVAFLAVDFFALVEDFNSVDLSESVALLMATCSTSLLAGLIFFGTAISEFCIGLALPTGYASSF